ncbi:MAG: hypothetical protein Fur0021_10320 [Candidatus Promineifilaceae bacterium]
MGSIFRCGAEGGAASDGRAKWLVVGSHAGATIRCGSGLFVGIDLGKQNDCGPTVTLPMGK